jgi:hypothetical protein
MVIRLDTPHLREGDMVRQLLVGGGVSVINIPCIGHDDIGVGRTRC